MEQALLLTEPSGSLETGRLAGVLDFFGVANRRLTIAEFLAVATDGDGANIRLLCSSGSFLKLWEALEQKPNGTRFWRERVHSVFVFAAGESGSLEQLARRLTGDAKASAVSIRGGAEWTISGQFPKFCQSMSGVKVRSLTDGGETGLVFDSFNAGAIRLISNGHGAALVQINHRSAPIFLSTAGIVDLEAGLPGRDFDIRRHFLAAVPVVMYVRWAFARTCWQPPETAACLVIDDPLLQPRYGFLEFGHLLGLMHRHHFSTNIAFIPWNWRRSSADVVRLFRENPGQLSLSVHGCDHTGGEFGTANRSRLAWKSSQASERMSRHESRTGIRHDRVMVFPQGVFSVAAMEVLKRGDFIGVVNSEVISADPQPPAIRISDVWNVAVMNYSDFPIFTRRYPSDGVENFAFDILLGKPCLVLVHHDGCRGRCRPLAEFIDRLNALNARLVWRNLAEVVRRSFRQRELSPGVVEVEMFGTELRVENPSIQRKRFHIRKREAAPATIREIIAESQPLNWTVSPGRIVFEVELDPGESKIIRIHFSEFPANGFTGESLRYRAKATLRRYLSEVRDNYVTRKPFAA